MDAADICTAYGNLALAAPEVTTFDVFREMERMREAAAAQRLQEEIEIELFGSHGEAF